MSIQKLDLDAQVAELETELAELRHRQREHRDAEWVRSLAVTIGSACFSSGDLMRHARINPELAAALEGMSARQIGKRLAALSGRALGNVRLDRVLRNSAGCMWEIRLTP